MLAGLQFANPGDVTDPINANDSEVICCISTVTYDLISYDYMQHDSRQQEANFTMKTVPWLEVICVKKALVEREDLSVAGDTK